ncbi:hypothetical protein BDY24DRAFT_390983 [Mrakia frigida]|uniref:uncharacterized protein n=1 Tax=Mrakia frigida TaxID=29902 RepID=UPI003FCC02CC
MYPNLVSPSPLPRRVRATTMENRRTTRILQPPILERPRLPSTIQLPPSRTRNLHTISPSRLLPPRRRPWIRTTSTLESAIPSRPSPSASPTFHPFLHIGTPHQVCQLTFHLLRDVNPKHVGILCIDFLRSNSTRIYRAVVSSPLGFSSTHRTLSSCTCISI